MDFWSHIPAGGTVFNSGAIIAGGGVGLLIGKFIPARMHTTIFQCFGLFCLYLGFSMTQKLQSLMIVLASLVVGAVIGEIWDWDSKVTHLGNVLKTKLNIGGESFTEGFVTTTLLYCVGSMGVLGAIQNGVQGDPSLLITKGVMDGTAAVLFAASLGVGVLFSALPLFIYQGLFTLAATWAEPFITPAMLDNLSGLGGLMLMAIGFNLMKVTQIKTCNLLPGLLLVLLLSAVF